MQVPSFVRVPVEEITPENSTPGADADAPPTKRLPVRVMPPLMVICPLSELIRESVDTVTPPCQVLSLSIFLNAPSFAMPVPFNVNTSAPTTIV